MDKNLIQQHQHVLRQLTREQQLLYMTMMLDLNLGATQEPAFQEAMQAGGTLKKMFAEGKLTTLRLKPDGVVECH